MSFFAELKRRNVVRVAIAYAVASWVLIQIGDVAAQNFEAPGWVMKMFITALVVGFPIVLFFSWAYEITPEGIKKESEIDRSQSISQETGKKLEYVTIALLVMAIAFIAVDRLVPQQAAPRVVATEQITNETASTDPAGAEEATSNNSIAVLPFLNMSNDPDQEYFSDGIAEELLNLLVRVEGLQVASRTSSFAYKGASPNIPQIASDLKVANILEGSVRKSGNRVRITAQLIDTRNDRHLWSETFDRELTDIFAIQDEIATAIVSALRTELGLDIDDQAISVAAATENLDAYDLFLKAHDLLINRQSLDECIALLERAVELDPNYARAWADLGAAASVAPSWGYTARDYDALASAATTTALELDESQSMAWAVLANIVLKDPAGQDQKLALHHLDMALEKDPKNTTALLWRGDFWTVAGFQDKAHADWERCVEIDPAYLNCQWHIANNYALAGDSEKSRKFFAPIFRKGFVVNVSSIVPVYAQQGEWAEAALAARWVSDHPDYPVQEWLDALEYPGEDYSQAVASAEKWLSEENKNGMVEALMLAFGAYDKLKLDPNWPASWIWTRQYPGFAGSPDFKRLVNELNLPDFWRKNGFPPQCRPVGERDFECD